MFHEEGSHVIYPRIPKIQYLFYLSIIGHKKNVDLSKISFIFQLPYIKPMCIYPRFHIFFYVSVIRHTKKIE